jgi:hypothetical protein
MGTGPGYTGPSNDYTSNPTNSYSYDSIQPSAAYTPPSASGGSSSSSPQFGRDYGPSVNSSNPNRPY